MIEQCILNSNGWKWEDGTSAVIIGDLGGANVCGNLADRKKEGHKYWCPKPYSHRFACVYKLPPEYIMGYINS
jgi:hypothetical protein